MENHPKYHTVIIDIREPAIALKQRLVRLNHAADVLECVSMVEHEVDCQLLGSTFRQFCNDPLIDICVAMSVPTDIRKELAMLLFTQVEQMLNNATQVLPKSRSYDIHWLSQTAGILKPSESVVQGHCVDYNIYTQTDRWMRYD